MAFRRFRRNVIYVLMNWKYKLLKPNPKNMLKISIFSLMLATLSPAVVSANESVSINKVGAFKFIVSTPAKSNVSVVITDADNNVIHQEYLNNTKLFNFNNLSDGKYNMTILDSYKKVVETKSFEINTQVKKELVTIQ
jgi:hypothetical protein